MKIDESGGGKLYKCISFVVKLMVITLGLMLLFSIFSFYFVCC